MGRNIATLVIGALVAAVAVGAIAEALVVGAGKAGAAQTTPTKATIEATQFAVASGQTGEASAVCPGSKRAVGGGVVQSGPAEESMEVIASGPLDSSGVTSQTNDGDIAKMWYTAVYNGSTQQRIYRVFAICSSTSKATIAASQFTVSDSSRLGEEVATCGQRRALGGGVVQSGQPNPSAAVSSNGPLDESGVTKQTVTGDVAKEWYASVGSFTSEDLTYRVFAICSGGSDATIKATSLFTVPPDQTVERAAVCGGNKRALGGGIVQSGTTEVDPIDFYEQANGPLDSSGVTLQTNSGDIAKQWYAAVSSNDSDGRFKVMAICGT